MNNRERFVSTLLAGTESLGVPLTDEQVARMWAHYSRVLETNRRFNLTRITDPAEAGAKLYADSLAPFAWARENNARLQTCLDIGTGAGIPAVPLAIARPKWRITAIDSTGKKADFVRQCAKEMSIRNLCAIQARAGQWKPPGMFDLVVLKAIGLLAQCLAYTKGLVARAGFVVVFKGPSLSREELDRGNVRAEQIGLQSCDAFAYDLPLRDETLEHTLIVYRRVARRV